VVEDHRGRVEAAGRAIGRVRDLVEMAAQRFDIAASRLSAGLHRNVAAHERDLVRITSRLSPLLLQRPQRVHAERLAGVSARLAPALERKLDRCAERLLGLEKLRASLNPDRPLRLGFARVHREDGALVTTGASLTSGERVSLVFQDKENPRAAVVDGDGSLPRPKSAARPRRAPAEQGDLF
jgi:exodeoxyribonuclease VII large subunit